MTGKIQALARTLRELLGLLWQSRPLLLPLLIALTVLHGCVPPLAAWVTREIVDALQLSPAGATPGSPPDHLLMLIALQVAVILLTQVLPPTVKFCNDELGRALKYVVQAAVYRHINELQGVAHFENSRFHDTIRLAVEGSQHAAIQGFNLFKDMVQQLITLLGFFAALLLFNRWLAILVVVAALPQFYARLRISLQRFGLAGELSPKERRMYYLGALLNMPQSAKEIRLFNIAPFLLQRFLHTQREVHDAQRAQDAREWRWQLLLDLLAGLAAAFVLACIVFAAYAGRISVGDVVLYGIAVAGVQSALTALLLNAAGLNESALFYTHMQRLQNLEDSLYIAPSPKPAQALRDAIELRNVSFRYADDHPWVLHDVSLRIPAGQCLALVGLNGAGKTTLVKLLTRLYDTSAGSILWDGVDIRELDVTQLRGQIAAIFQDFMHYDFSAADNIGLGRVQDIANRDRIVTAARQAGVHDKVTALPQGYDTVLSRWLADAQGGTDLSGGEWQKIALARMYMRDASLLILDEPTAALDGAAEIDVYNQFVAARRQRTSILISHRFSTVKMADRIVVLDNGRIAEDGSHRSLLELDGVYARLYHAQASRYQ